MLSRPAKAVLALFVVTIVTIDTQATAQIGGQTAETTTLLNRNASFESGTTNWSGTKVTATVLARDWVPGQTTTGIQNYTFNYFQGEKANLGTNLARLQGNGVYGATFKVTPGRTKHIFNAFAFKSATSPQGSPGYAAVGVTYYDASGVEVHKQDFAVSTADKNLLRGVGDGLNFYCWGIDVPSNATYGYIFGYTSTGTDLFVDNLAIFEVANTVTAPKIARNLVANFDFSSTHFTANAADPTCVGYGTEFWEEYRDWSTAFDRTWGSPDQEEWAYQYLPVKPGYTYALLTTGFKDTSASSSVGVDLYDASWKPIGKRVIDLTGLSFESRAIRLEIPQKCAHASLVVYAAPLPSDATFGTIVTPSVLELEPRLSTATSMVVDRSSVFSSRSGRIGVTISVIYSDADGIDLKSIDSQDVYFTSKSSTTKFYSVTASLPQSYDSDRIVAVSYTYTAPTVNDPSISDVSGILLRTSQVKDKLGNAATPRTIKPVLP